VTESRRLLAVHAHPDDETITTGGLLLRCAEAGIGTTLLTCTDGRYGPVSPEYGRQLDPSELVAVRTAELDSAAEVLRIGEVRRLGHHDSNMTGLPENHLPDAFWAQPTDALVAEVVRVLRDCRPHVVVTYDPFGNTGHPDHVQAHRITVLAVAAASQTRCFPEAGPSWAVGQLLHPVYPISALRSFVDEENAAGRDHPFDGRDVEEVDYGRADDEVTHRVSIGDVHEAKHRALLAHRTQVGSHYPVLYRAALARRDHEHYHRVWTRENMPDFDDVLEPVATR
jgi:LmbE family N-acetylglucosaminyl deacetylase